MPSLSLVCQYESNNFCIFKIELVTHNELRQNTELKHLYVAEQNTNKLYHFSSSQSMSQSGRYGSNRGPNDTDKDIDDVQYECEQGKDTVSNIIQ